jgi:hypothetical protein
MVTAFRNITDTTPNYTSIERCLQRIKEGKSIVRVEDIRATLDKEHRNVKKAQLPSILFSGEFKGRNDKDLIKHSGYLVLDFDGEYNPSEKRDSLKKYSFIYAAWVSPSGDGVKALAKIKDGAKHTEHFFAIREIFPDLDRSGKNVARVCYESYDPELWINENAVSFDKIKEEKKIEVSIGQTTHNDFNNILKWLTNKGDAFQTGERNLFMFKLASACCRFGINETDCLGYASASFLMQDNTFTQDEARRTITSAYKANPFGTATFEKDSIVEKVTKKEIEIDADVYNKEIKPKDVIFGLDVKESAIDIYRYGYKSADSTGVLAVDEFYKYKTGEITLLSGIGNYGKSNFLKYLMIVSVIKKGRKWAIFTPEEMPAQEFYFDLTEVYLGANCTPYNTMRPSEEDFTKAYDIISNHIFCIYPKTVMPTPDYIKERFLELIIKENIYGCVIDPFNQMSNDYGKSGGNTAKYLETFLSDCSRFAIANNQVFIIIAHPHKLIKDSTGNYPCPDVFEIADGAMWNNKMDNILIYHRPNHQQDPDNPVCELHSKKIRRQKIVGKKGTLSFELDRVKRRYLFSGIDVLETPNPTISPNTTFLNMDKFTEPTKEEEVYTNNDPNPF